MDFCLFVWLHSACHSFIHSFKYPNGFELINFVFCFIQFGCLSYESVISQYLLLVCLFHRKLNNSVTFFSPLWLNNKFELSNVHSSFHSCLVVVFLLRTKIIGAQIENEKVERKCFFFGRHFHWYTNGLSYDLYVCVCLSMFKMCYLLVE